MNVAIIGAGNVGEAVAYSSVRAGHTVTITSADPAMTEAAANATGARAVGSNRQVESAEIITLAVTAKAVADIAASSATRQGETVVDVTNRPAPDPGREGCTSMAEGVRCARREGAQLPLCAKHASLLAGQQAAGYVAADRL